MKKLFVLFILGVFLAGCGTAAKLSEFWEHDTMYKNFDHLEFSIYGYKNPTRETYQKSQEQGWWGIPIPYKEAEK